MGDGWFQQDGAMDHTARTSMNLLREHFPEWLTSLRGNLQWPVRPPDLAPCDYFPWGYLKSLGYTTRPTTLGQLKYNIRAAIADISTDMQEKVDRNFKIRLSQCIDEDSGHLRDVFFKA